MAYGGLAGLLALGAGAATAAPPADLADCAAITDDGDRLRCYDGLATAARSGAPGGAGRPGGAADAEVRPALALPTPRPEPAATPTPEPAAASSVLARHWELDPASQRGVFHFRPHHENYLIATYNPSPNDAPYRPLRALSPEADSLSKAELAFQIGFKLKLAEDVADQPLDLWFGYTQRSFWQVTNQEASSPFRETDYQPELMAVIPTDLALPGLRLRFLNLGVIHQSNGQATALSRSWNRVYAQAGFERPNFTLLARVWKRFNEAAGEDDNPDIIDYLGRGDLVGTYRWNGNAVSLLTRYNFQTDKGAAQLAWTFPLVSNLNGYLQYFAGYGQTLIDYDAFQRVLGLGVLVDF